MDLVLLETIKNALTYAREIVLALGLVGNILSFVVFSRKTFANNSISVYCRALAVADCFGVVQLIYDIINYQFNSEVAMESNFACKFFFFVTFGISPISGWLLTALTFDNMIRVLQTPRFRFINEKKYQYLIVAVIVIFNVVLYSTIIIQVVKVSNDNSSSMSCDLNDLDEERFIHYVYVVESSFVPFALMVISILVIVRCMQNSRRRVHLNQSSESSRRTKEFKFAFASIFLNVVFIFFKSPLTFYYILDLDDSVIGVRFLLSSLLCFYLNYSARFIFHLIGNSIFRNEFLRMCHLSKKNNTDTTANSMSTRIERNIQVTIH